MDKHTALRELERFRKIAERQHKENEDLLKRLHAAWNEKRGHEALLAAILTKYGEITVPREDVSKALKGELGAIRYGRDECGITYTLKVVSTDGEEYED